MANSSVKFFQERNIKYFGRDFRSLKEDAIKFSQAHHSGVLSDYNEASPFMALVDINADIGASLSFQIDQAFMELNREQQRQIKNVASFAKSIGYRPQGKAAAHTIQSFFLQVPAINQQGGQVPDDTYSPIMRKGTKVQGPNGTFFETLDDINFATSSVDYPREVTGSQFDPNSGLPTFFAIKKDVEIIAGETKTDTFSITDFVQFKQLKLSNQNVLEVISCTDSDGNEWFEVDYLAQDMVFDSALNTNSDNGIVPYVLKLLPVPRRFITDRNVEDNTTSLIFGSGDGVNFDDELIPNLADLALPLAGRRTFSSYPLDPQNFLKTRSLGLSPYNTTITVTYRVGGGVETNVLPGSIDNVVQATLDFSSTNLNPIKKGQVISSLQTINVGRSSGGRSEENISEIKINSEASFAAQNRVITREDMICRVLSLPAKFGKPEKVYVRETNALINNFSVDVHILSEDPNGYLIQSTPTLADNIRKYVNYYRGLNDGVNILQTDIINLKCNFGVIIAPKINKTEGLTKCLSALKDYFDTNKRQIGEPIVISEVNALLQSIYGVVSVYKIEFKNIFCPQQNDTGYSTVRFNVQAHTKNGLIYCPENAIFEFKFPASDLIGVAL